MANKRTLYQAGVPDRFVPRLVERARWITYDDPMGRAITLGLNSSVCTNDFRQMQRYIAGLRVRTVNSEQIPGHRIEMSPCGGIKDFGLGYREHVIEVTSEGGILVTHLISAQSA